MKAAKSGKVHPALPTTAPQANAKPHFVEAHGIRLQDEYHWLRERENPEVLEHLERENAFTSRTLRSTEPLQDQLYREMVGRIQETDQSVPYPHGPYFYYQRTATGRQYPIYCRKRGSLQSPEEIVLDLNQLAVGRPYLDLGVLEISPDHTLLAYSIDCDGSEEYTLFIKDLTSGCLHEDRIPGTYDSVEWAGDSRTLFYNRLDAAHRPYQLKRHQLGSVPEQDVLVYQEDDEAFFLSLSKTRSQEYLLLELHSNRSSEVHYLNAHQPEDPFRVIEPRQPRVEYSVEHHDGYFYLTTNHQAREFRLVRAPVERPCREAWEELIPHREDVQLEEVMLFDKFISVFERADGLSRLRISNLDSWEFHAVDFDEEVYTICPEHNLDFGASYLRFTFSSMITPETVYDYHVFDRRLEIKKRDAVLGGFRPEHYRSRRVYAPAPDGTLVPISLVYREGTQPRGGGAPVVLYGYGAYGLTVEPGFNRNRLSLLDRGVTFAIAHVRGGGEMGRRWYEDGKLLQKENTFTDFIACAEYLIEAGYAAPDRLAIMGGSAGGLLVAVAANRRPELFRAVVARVPFVDVVNTMLDRSLPLTVTEHEEWGDPENEEFFRILRAYSPYDNVRRQTYPDMLVTAGWNDPRVAYWEPAKWVARIRAMASGGNVPLLHTDLTSGHAGASGRYSRLHEVAMIYAFLLERLAGRPSGTRPAPPI